MKILNFGSLNIDYVYHLSRFLQPGETISSKRLDINCGGKGLNQSIALAKAGMEVFHAGNVGKDGSFLVEKLQEYGVNTHWIKTLDEKMDMQ